MNKKAQANRRLEKISERMGFALLQVQNLEENAATYFVMVTQAKPGMGYTAGMALAEKAQSKMFGITVKRLRKAGVLNDDLENRFTSILAERNWLVHDSRKTIDRALFNLEEFDKVIKKIESISDESLALLKDLYPFVEAHLLNNGFTKDQINRTVQKVLEEWIEADPS